MKYKASLHIQIYRPFRRSVVYFAFTISAKHGPSGSRHRDPNTVNASSDVAKRLKDRDSVRHAAYRALLIFEE